MHAVFADDVELSFGDRHVLVGFSLTVTPGERVGIVGPNGCGKSTLLSLFAGTREPDGGRVHRAGRTALLHQDPDFHGETVEEVALAALSWHGDLRQAYEDALSAGRMEEAADLQARLDDVGWVVDHRVDSLLSQTGAPPKERALAGLSGGERRRLALAVTLLAQPDVLLLDEPTNHLDAQTIDWLEKFLAGYRGTVVLVTHDRYLLEAVATRIVEVEHGKAVSYDGSYADYLIGRAERHAQQQRAEDRRLRILARESAWAARSPAARSTKQKARLKRLEELQEKGTLPKDRSFSLDFSTGLKTSGTLLEIHGLTLAIGDRMLARGIELAVRPGDRLGILGPNGAGKSTLLRTILGEHPAESGRVDKASRVRIGMLDQARTGLEPTDTVFEAAGGGNDQVQVGENWVHVAGFLKQLLFDREQLEARTATLSGGERARLLLAKKMLEGNSVLLLDEPTNDLDLWTLRVLEEALLAYDGAALIVTHDRAFLDRVCTGVVVFEPGGRVVRYADRQQAERAEVARREQARRAEERAAEAAEQATQTGPEPSSAPTGPKKKRSWKEERELEGLPDAIEAAETKVAELEGILADPETYRSRVDEVGALNQQLADAQAQVEKLYERWEELAG